MSMGFGQLLIILFIILILFGAGRLPQIMSDLGKGLKSFKASVNDNSDDTTDKK
ncbi:MAG: twin-arginine translocase TatA/TatE family subunit [Rickettsiaceae bacterium]|nr:twin-arginine translocase TatA/TatE family subunit [Rickettsiaceae bacterium]